MKEKLFSIINDCLINYGIRSSEAPLSQVADILFEDDSLNKSFEFEDEGEMCKEEIRPELEVIESTKSSITFGLLYCHPYTDEVLETHAFKLSLEEVKQDEI